MMWWGHGWWWAGAVFMVICMVAMVRMMGHGGHGSHDGHGSHGSDAGHGWDDPAERTLANRLASGEIDVEEYERLREVIRRTDSTSGGPR